MAPSIHACLSELCSPAKCRFPAASFIRVQSGRAIYSASATPFNGAKLQQGRLSIRRCSMAGFWSRSSSEKAPCSKAGLNHERVFGGHATSYRQPTCKAVKVRDWRRRVQQVAASTKAFGRGNGVWGYCARPVRCFKTDGCIGRVIRATHPWRIRTSTAIVAKKVGEGSVRAARPTALQFPAIHLRARRAQHSTRGEVHHRASTNAHAPSIQWLGTRGERIVGVALN